MRRLYNPDDHCRLTDIIIVACAHTSNIRFPDCTCNNIYLYTRDSWQIRARFNTFNGARVVFIILEILQFVNISHDCPNILYRGTFDNIVMTIICYIILLHKLRVVNRMKNNILRAPQSSVVCSACFITVIIDVYTERRRI